MAPLEIASQISPLSWQDRAKQIDGALLSSIPFAELEEQGQEILRGFGVFVRDVLLGLGETHIRSLEAAMTYHLSASRLHQSAARRWLAANPREAERIEGFLETHQGFNALYSLYYESRLTPEDRVEARENARDASLLAGE